MSKTIKAIAKFNRTYSIGPSGFKTKENQEYDVPEVYVKKYPNHFIVEMKADKKAPKKTAEMKADKNA